MKRYAYKILTSPSERELNELGEQGWKVVAGGSVSSSSYVKMRVIMERYIETFDPAYGRL